MSAPLLTLLLATSPAQGPHQALRDPQTGAPQRVLLVNTLVGFRDNHVAFTLPSEHADALDRAAPTDALRQALAAHFPLAPATHITVLDKGRSWRWLDAMFHHEFTIARIGKSLEVRSASVPVYATNPGEGKAALRCRVSLSQLAYVYRGAGNYYLIGPEPECKDDGMLYGWVSADSAARWDSRLALEWDAVTARKGAATRRQRPAEIWESAQAAHNAFSANRPASPFRESWADGEAVPMGPGQMRFPLLAWRGDREFPRFRPQDRNPLLKVGFINNQPPDSAALKRLNQVLADAQAALHNVDLMLVVDKTGSMRRYRHDIGKAVAAVGKQLLERPGGKINLRVACTYFGDFDTEGNQPISTPETWTDVTNPADLKQRITALADPNNYSFGETPYAQLYLGITEALDASRRWRSNALRMVIVITDGGNRTEKTPKHASVANIVDRLVGGSRLPTDFYTIRMWDPAEPHTGDETKSHDQLEHDIAAINDALRARVPQGSAEKPVAAFFDAADGDRLQEQIRRRFAGLSKQVEVWNEQLLAIKHGGRPHSEIDPRMRAFLKANGVDLDEMPSFYREGFVWQWDEQGVPQVRVVALVRRDELEQLSAALAQVGAGRAALDRVARASLTCLLGEPAAELSAKDIERRLSAVKEYLPAGTILARYPAVLDVVDNTLVQRLRERGVQLAALLKPGAGRQFQLPGSRDDWFWLDLQRELR
jgi:hypothetical protein